MDSERVEAIEACRTCGIFYMTSSNYLRHLFQSPVEQPDMMLIRLELTQWKVDLAENDGLPQHICSTCIHEFHKVFKFRAACIETQEQFKYFCNLREENHANIKIKTEKPDPDENKPVCDFIYVDDLSDTEYDGATPFNVPHVPIKEEIIEAATIPMEETEQSVNMVESALNVVNSTERSILNVSLARTLQNESDPNNTGVVVAEKSAEHVECKLCQHISYNNDEHKQHLQKAHEVKDMECHICGKEFKNATTSRLKFHMKWHTLNKHVKCTLCGFVCNSKDTLKEHKRANHSRINCKICGKGVLAKKMKYHLRNHELLTNFPCEYCTEVFSTEDERENHIWQLHANDCNYFQTEIRQEATDDDQEEILCQESVIDLLPYKFLCAHCDERFMEQIDLESHVHERHRPQTHIVQNELVANTQVGQDSIPNEECEEMSDNEVDKHESNKIAVFEDYDNDEKQHSNENDLFSNSLIGEQQNTQFTETPLAHAIQATYNRETDEENINENCDKQGQHKNEAENVSNVSNDSNDTDLKDESSTGTRPFACAKCAETFASIEQLRQHHERHLAVNSPGKSKFKCNLCDKLFDLKFSLNRHVKKHKHSPI